MNIRILHLFMPYMDGGFNPVSVVILFMYLCISHNWLLCVNYDITRNTHCAQCLTQYIVHVFIQCSVPYMANDSRGETFAVEK